MGIISNQTAKPRGALKILWGGLKLPCNNLALLHPIFLLSFLSSSLLFLISSLCLTPLILDFTTKFSLMSHTDSKSPKFSLLATAALKELKELELIAVVVLIVSFILKSLVATATVHVLSTAHSSKTPSSPSSSKLKEVFSGLNWSLIKRCMITQLYVAFVNLGCILIVGLTAVVLSISPTDSSSSPSLSDAALSVIFLTVAVLEICLYLYLLMVVDTSVVVSVVEEGYCYGLEAITKANKLLGGRRRKQTIRIALVELAVAGFFYLAYDLGMAHARPGNMARWALGFGRVAVGVVINVLTWSVQTVYYYECSAGHAEGEIAAEGGFEYKPVPTQVNEALL